MNTKIVYVLTCMPDGAYIEIAFVSIWSVRHFNPNTPIILLTDDKTDKLLTGTRGQLLNYITEKIVIPFNDDLNAHYRSRWLKTSLRNLIEGDLLFIDCDTIILRDLSPIELIDADIAMVRDENINIADEVDSVTQPMAEVCSRVGVDIMREEYYFNSGVMYVKDTALTHILYKKWHKFWMEGVQQGINVDQPTFAKANIDCGRPVQLLEDKWNTIVYTQIPEIYNTPYILHFWRGITFLYNQSTLDSIRKNGLTDMTKYYILHPTETFLPFNNRIYKYSLKDYLRFYKTLRRTLKDYGHEIDARFSDVDSQSITHPAVLKSLYCHYYSLAAAVITFQKLYYVRFSRKYVYKENYYERNK